MSAGSFLTLMKRIRSSPSPFLIRGTLFLNQGARLAAGGLLAAIYRRPPRTKIISPVLSPSTDLRSGR